MFLVLLFVYNLLTFFINKLSVTVKSRLCTGNHLVKKEEKTLQGLLRSLHVIVRTETYFKQIYRNANNLSTVIKYTKFT